MLQSPVEFLQPRRIFTSTSWGPGSRVTNNTRKGSWLWLLHFVPCTWVENPKGNYVQFRTLLRSFCVLGNHCWCGLVGHHCYFQLVRQQHPWMRNAPLPMWNTNNHLWPIRVRKLKGENEFCYLCSSFVCDISIVKGKRCPCSGRGIFLPFFGYLVAPWARKVTAFHSLRFYLATPK
jgi:hypothetical protein